MWIRSQNKTVLYNCDNIGYSNKLTDKKHQILINVRGERYWLGEYKSKKRCIEVLDDIEKRIDVLYYVPFMDNIDALLAVYQMPKK